LENSINPRLLLALLEYQNHWVYGQPVSQDEIKYPIGLVDQSEQGLYHQLVRAVNQLSIGYYSWREGRLTELKFSDGVTARLAPDLNAGSAAIQYYFAHLYPDSQRWLQALDPNSGFPALYQQMFGDPWERAQRVEPLYPPGLTQPPMILPFKVDEYWSYTGGPHGAWEHDGSYAAIDFAPPSIGPGCIKSNVWVVAAASGLVARSEAGVVVLDLDGDGYEQTGWVLLYLHVSTEGRIPVGSWVEAGTPLGHPSCEGGLATGTHVHIARKFNGEWMAAGGPMPFVLSGWVVQAGEAAYKGRLVRDDQVVEACTCSSAKTRIGRKEQDP
jgi:murein DD-endopeptidase MepM/ murein hydrolase activator NlpD